MVSDGIKDIVEISSNIASTVAIIAAGIWFIRTTQYKRRLQFDLDCRFVRINNNDEFIIAEVQFIVENKGFVEHRLYNLKVSLHTFNSEVDLKEEEESKELIFDRIILDKVEIQSFRKRYFFVRPGVRQVITHIVKVPSSISAIRVTSSFNYNKSGKSSHTARKVFKVKAE